MKKQLPEIHRRSIMTDFLRLLSVLRTLVRTRASALPVSKGLSKYGNDFLGKTIERGNRGNGLLEAAETARLKPVALDRLAEARC